MVEDSSGQPLRNSPSPVGCGEANGAESDRQPRALPDWAWGLAIIFHPLGLFIALAAARAMNWSIAVPLAVLSYVGLAAFVFGMMWAEGLPEGSAYASRLMLFAMGAYYLAVGYVQYRIGLRSRLWTERATRAWHAVGCLAIVCAVLIVAGLILTALIGGG